MTTDLTPPSVQPKRSAAKWGIAALAGFQPVPDALFMKQKALGLDPVDLVVLLNITSYWWYSEQLPFARSSTIAERMGTSVRTVQRSIRKLETKGYIKKEDVRTKEGDFVPALDPAGLVDKLGALALKDPALSMRIEKYKPALTNENGGQQ